MIESCKSSRCDEKAIESCRYCSLNIGDIRKLANQSRNCLWWLLLNW